MRPVHILGMSTLFLALAVTAQCKDYGQVDRKLTKRRAAGVRAVTEEPPTAFPRAAARTVIRGHCRWMGPVPPQRKLPVQGEDYCVKSLGEKGLPVDPRWEIHPVSLGVPHCVITVKDAEKRWTFEVPEELVVLTRPRAFTVKCDIHGWMTANVHVLPHPLRTVTDENGRFSLPALPPGRYRLEARHENRDWTTEPQDVVIAAGDSKKVTPVTFQFREK